MKKIQGVFRLCYAVKNIALVESKGKASFEVPWNECILTSNRSMRGAVKQKKVDMHFVGQ